MSAAPEVEILRSGELDVEAHAALQRRVFGHLLEENDIPLTRMSAEVFAWKLSPPRGEARIGMVREGGAILSTCTAFPVELGDREGRPRAWHLCDAASAPEARGRGYFGRVLRALIEDTQEQEWLFAFPNGQSRGAFVRERFHTIVKVPLWVRPTIGGAPKVEAEVRPIEAFGPEHDALAARLAAQGGRTALRSASYLRWRYLAHPYFRYQCLELRREGQVEGLLVLNRMEARGRVSLWVMELLHTDRAGARELALAARAQAKEQGCDVLLSMANVKLPGALRMPPCFLPKEHVLMVRSGGTGESKLPGEWEVHTGDWDTF